MFAKHPNRITSAQWWARILSHSLFFDTPPKKRRGGGGGKIKENTGHWPVDADRVRSCGGNVGGCAIKTFPRLIYCKYFLQYEKRWERKRGSLISEIVIAPVALPHTYFPRCFIYVDERRNPLLDWGFKAEACQTGNNIYDGKI